MYVQKLKGKDVHNKSTDGKSQWRNGRYKRNRMEILKLSYDIGNIKFTG